MQARALASDNTCYINSMDQFLSLYKTLDEEDDNILCEMYQHDLVLSGKSKWNMNPYVGDVQLRVFTSFMNNQIKWIKAMSFVWQDENMGGLNLKGEPNPPELYKETTEIMKNPKFVATLEDKQKAVILSCENWIALNRLETIFCI